jgi:hypothetical protein
MKDRQLDKRQKKKRSVFENVLEFSAPGPSGREPKDSYSIDLFLSWFAILLKADDIH